MKKVIKMSLVAVAALLIFLNVSLNLNSNKVEGLGLSTNIQIAHADANCFYHPFFEDCMCMTHYAQCGGVCPQGMTFDICNSAEVK
jgi:hypothetical protein